MKKILTLLCLILLFTFTKSQDTIKISLYPSDNIDNPGFKFMLKTFSPEKEIATNKGKIVIKKFYLQPWFYYFSMYRKTKDKKYLSYLNDSGGFDSTIIKKAGVKTGYAIFVERNVSTNIARLVIDKNQNDYFGDDEFIERKFDDPNKISFPAIMLKNVAFFDGKKMCRKDIVLYISYDIVKFYTAGGVYQPDTTISVMIKSTSNTGFKKIGNNTYKFTTQISDPKYDVHFKDERHGSTVYMAKANENFVSGIFYYIGDTISLENKTYKLQHIDSAGTELTIIKLKNDNVTYNPADSEYNFVRNNFMNNEPFELRSNHNKYTLIDFWGTWCIPCIKKMPELVEIYAKADTSKIQFVSICYDDPLNIEKAKKLLVENHVTWAQILQDRNIKGSNNIVENFNVYKYPSFYLKDPLGHIVNKETFTESSIEDILPLLDKLGLIKK